MENNLGNKEVMARNILKYMAINEKSRSDICNDLHIKYTTLTDWIKGRTYPRIDKIELLANYFHVSKADLVEDSSSQTASIPQFSNIRPLSKSSLPVLGSVACGEPIFMDEHLEFYVDAVESIHADFILIAKGDSMIGARIHDGDLVFIRQQPEVENGEIAAVAIKDEATLKRVYRYANNSLLVLRAENPAFGDMEFSGEELEDVRILGKAVAFQSDVR